MLDYILLGTLQGIFEWLPVSSEGILALAGQLLALGANPVDLAIFLHLGTFVAVLIYFRSDWSSVLAFRDKQLLRFLVITTIVSLAVGFPLYLLVRSIAAGALLLALVGLGLLLTALFHRSRKTLGLGKTRLALLAGLLQGLAVIPGLSRSGATIFGLSLGELSNRDILRFSYMMSAPVVLASSAYLLLQEPILLGAWPALVSSFVVGMLTLHALMRAAQRINFFLFALSFAVLCFIGAAVSLLL